MAAEVDGDFVRAAAAATIAGECSARLLKLVLSAGTSFLSCSPADDSRAANCDRMYCSNGRSGSKLGLSGCNSGRPAATVGGRNRVRQFKRDLFDVHVRVYGCVNGLCDKHVQWCSELHR